MHHWGTQPGNQTGTSANMHNNKQRLHVSNLTFGIDNVQPPITSPRSKRKAATNNANRASQAISSPRSLSSAIKNTQKHNFAPNLGSAEYSAQL